MIYSVAMNNTLHKIHPYKHNGNWVFDDDRFGLSREPFVFGADSVISSLAAMELGRVERFTLLFGSVPMPNCHVFKCRSENPDKESGAEYYWPEQRAHFWLCPALYHYFDQLPEKIYVSVMPWDGAASEHPSLARHPAEA
jgi:hypothetical protein